VWLAEKLASTMPNLHIIYVSNTHFDYLTPVLYKLTLLYELGIALSLGSSGEYCMATIIDSCLIIEIVRREEGIWHAHCINGLVYLICTDRFV